MSFSAYAWLAVASYAVHILEEHTFDWRNWARDVVGLPVEWPDFYVTNSVVVVLGMAAAMVADEVPVAALTYAALMLINAIFFHILPVLRTGGRFSPGLATALVLFLPLSIAMTLHALGAGLVGPIGLVAAAGGGALLMACPVVMLKLKSHRYFDQTRVSSR